MKIRPLVLGPPQLAAIKAALAAARKTPVALRDGLSVDAGDKIQHHTLALADQNDAHHLAPTYDVLIPVGYRMALCFEEQPDGLALHVSVSVDERGKMPAYAAVRALLEAAGLEWATWHASWLEEFAPGHHAVNVIKIIEWRAEGRA